MSSVSLIDGHMDDEQGVMPEALEKQIRKKPLEKYSSVYGEYGYCPCCGRILLVCQGFKACPDCGQALDWSDTK